MPALIELAERMAACLLKGGLLTMPHVARFWVSESGHRAGGLMGIRHREPAQLTRKDVAFLALPDCRKWKPAEDKVMQGLLKGKANLFAVGRREDVEAVGLNPARFAGFTGGAAPEEGSYGIENCRPLATFRPLEQIIRGWVLTGETVAACTRAGRMPAIWMSVWLEGAMVRNNYFIEHNNLREPWFPPMFHKDYYIPPLRAGYVGESYLELVQRQWQALYDQADKLVTAGKWLAQARQAGKTAWFTAVGHSYPEVLDIHDKTKPWDRKQMEGYPIDWGWSYSDLNVGVPRRLGKGDAAMHLGYAPVNVPAVQRILRRGVKFVHTSPYGRPEDMPEHENFIWLDLPWRPGDATVDVPGYSVRILPMSSSAQTVAYFAMLCELADRMGWR